MVNIAGNINGYALELAIWHMWIADGGIFRGMCSPIFSVFLIQRYMVHLSKLFMNSMRTVTSV